MKGKILDVRDRLTLICIKVRRATALPSNRPQILDGLRDGPEIERQLADYQVEFTQAGNMTMNAAPGAHDDYVAALAMAWFGLMHCAGSLGPPREVRW